MIKFELSDDKYLNDINELIRPFEQRGADGFSLKVHYSSDGFEMKIILESDKIESFVKTYGFKLVYNDETQKKREEKRYLKIAVYRTLSFLTGINLPYGCLTGIRPTKLFAEIDANPDFYKKSAEEVFAEDYSVADSKIKLVKRIVEMQKPLRNTDGKCFDVFVFIPFCPTKCAYCSFVSLPLDRRKKLVEPYVDCLIQELKQTKELIRLLKIKVRAVYVGGGTPTAIPIELLDKILSECRFGAKEFTVEAGRPDTIDKAMLDMFERRKVTRISVNPQTFNNETLERIGRKHKSQDVTAVYGLAKGRFDVNMDLIAMLPGETFADFKRSVDKAIELNPENITIHTLYLKKGSGLKLSDYDNTDYATASVMVDYAYSALCANGYSPYYMYRQKYASGSLENVGYAKRGKECLYNIDIMEEDTSVLANGAAAISKKWTADKNLIERCANYKEPLEYIGHFDSVLEKQRAFWLDGSAEPPSKD